MAGWGYNQGDNQFTESEGALMRAWASGLGRGIPPPGRPGGFLKEVVAQLRPEARKGQAEGAACERQEGKASMALPKDGGRARGRLRTKEL